MAKTEHYYTKFEEDKFYHIYNRTVDRKPMFRNEGNFEFFLKRFDKYLSPVIDTYAYCLLGNHFHLLVRIQNLTAYKNLSNLNPDTTAHDIVFKNFRKFFQSYAMAFNKHHDRIGTLFQTPFKRALVDSESYFTWLVFYIHANPQLHGMMDDFRDWKWSSYHRLLIDNPSKLKKLEVLNWFGGKENFINYHTEKHQFRKDDNLLFEDDN